MLLTDHFTESELGVDGASPQIKENARALCIKVLEPIRQHYSLPLHITSGYRPPDHNAAVGGKPNSFHLYQDGKAAADFCIPGISVTQIFTWLRMVSGLPFDKTILEYKEDVPDIIHVQYDMMAQPRRLAYIGVTGDGKAYSPVEVA